jgi:hypothetical protein
MTAEILIAEFGVERWTFDAALRFRRLWNCSYADSRELLIRLQQIRCCVLDDPLVIPSGVEESLE